MSGADEPWPKRRHAVVEMRGIVKRFPGVVANAGVDFDLLPGEVHALLGENGAGKSTLMNVLYGLYPPDAGEVRLFGERVAFNSAADAIARGLGMVHQHFMLVKPFTVAENIVLGQRSPARAADGRPAHGPQTSGGALRPVRAGHRSRRRGLDPLGGRAAARRNPEGALPRRPGADPGRADGGAHAAGGARAARYPAPPGGRGQVHRFHLAQAGRGAGCQQPHHRPARRRGGGHCPDRSDRRA